jgi:hypothetical protein
MDPVDVRAHRIARPQRGLATRRQLIDEAAIAPSTVAARLRRGCWTAPHPTVVDLGTHERSWRKDVHAAVLAAGPHAWACHDTAAHLHGFLDAPRPPSIDVVVPRGRHARAGELRLRTTRALGRDEVTEVHGIPCTSVARTLLDLGVGTDLDVLERYLGDQVRRHHELLTTLLDLVDRHRSLPGRARLVRVIERLPSGATALGSPLEVLGVQRLRQHAAPPFVVQYAVRTPDGRRVKRVDVAWPELRIVLEFDGAGYHDLAGQRDADEAARAEMRDLGWHVEVVRRADLDGDRFAAFVDRVRRAAA